jgi:hypothetical protein
MNRPVRVTVLITAALITAAATLALGGCRTAAVAGLPAGRDPLGSVERRVDQIEKQIDQDGAG